MLLLIMNHCNLLFQIHLISSFHGTMSGWPEFYLDRFSTNNKLYDEPTSTDALMQLIQKMEVCSYSTAYSGIDSPGTAFAQLRAAASHITGADVDSPPHVHAIDSWTRTQLLFDFSTYI